MFTSKFVTTFAILLPVTTLAASVLTKQTCEEINGMEQFLHHIDPSYEPVETSCDDYLKRDLERKPHSHHLKPLSKFLERLSGSAFEHDLESSVEPSYEARALESSSPLAPEQSQWIPFNLVTVVTQGNCSFEDLQIVTMHIGAGLNAAVAIDASTSENFNFTQGGYVLNNTYIDLHFESGSNLPIYSLGLTNGGTPLIAGVSGDVNENVNLNGIAGQQTDGFVISEDGYITYEGTDFPFKTFTVCGGPTIFGPSTGNQLLWRNTTSTPDLVHCADVLLAVEYPEEDAEEDAEEDPEEYIEEDAEDDELCANE